MDLGSARRTGSAADGRRRPQQRRPRAAFGVAIRTAGTQTRRRGRGSIQTIPVANSRGGQLSRLGGKGGKVSRTKVAPDLARIAHRHPDDGLILSLQHYRALRVPCWGSSQRISGSRKRMNCPRSKGEAAETPRACGPRRELAWAQVPAHQTVRSAAVAGDGPKIVIERTRGGWRGGPRTQTQREPPAHLVVRCRSRPERQPGGVPDRLEGRPPDVGAEARGDRQIDALLVWLQPGPCVDTRAQPLSRSGTPRPAPAWMSAAGWWCRTRRPG